MRLAWLVLLLLPKLAVAASVDVTVTDQDDNLLENATVSFLSDIPQAVDKTRINIMDQVGRKFLPTVLPIQTGTLVSFPNTDDVRHHVYSFSHPNNFEIKLYHGKPNQPVAFNHPGIVVLGCNIHDGMIGYLQVVDTPWFASTGPSGIASVIDVPSGEYTLQVWHPDAGIQFHHVDVTLSKGNESLKVTLDLSGQNSTSSASTSPLQALFED